MAPFDHPSLTILNGHQQVDRDGDGRADDIIVAGMESHARYRSPG